MNGIGLRTVEAFEIDAEDNVELKRQRQRQRKYALECKDRVKPATRVEAADLI